MLYLKKNWKSAAALASGGWGLYSQTPKWLLPSPVIVIFSKTFVALTSLVTVKKD